MREQYSQLLPYVAHRAGPELRDRRDDCGTDRPARLYHWRRYAVSAAPAWRPARRAIRASTPHPTATASAKIFAGQNEEDVYRSPLTEIGVDAACRRLCSRHQRRGLTAKTISTDFCATPATPGAVAAEQHAAIGGARARSPIGRGQRDPTALSQLGGAATAGAWTSCRTDASATCICRTWARTAFASSSSGTIRSFARKR